MGLPTAPLDDTPHEDHFVRFWEASWDDYQRLLAIRGDRSAPRVSYLEGMIEVMSPSRSHESIKSLIGRLIEVYCLERGIEFSTYGSWTLSQKSVARGAEPDECYVFGHVAEPERPDLVIEVVWTSGGIDKLDIYGRLAVPEVWYWRNGRISVHVLDGEQYREVPGSVALPGIDLVELVSYMDASSTSQALRAYRDALRAKDR